MIKRELQQFFFPPERSNTNVNYYSLLTAFCVLIGTPVVGMIAGLVFFCMPGSRIHQPGATAALFRAMGTMLLVFGLIGLYWRVRAKNPPALTAEDGRLVALRCGGFAGLLTLVMVNNAVVLHHHHTLHALTTDIVPFVTCSLILWAAPVYWLLRVKKLRQAERPAESSIDD